MIKYIKGDATHPIGEGNKLIIHCCNDIGVWGAGFVLALSARWKQPEKEYLKVKPNYQLGDVQFVWCEPDIWVCNMIGQHGVGLNQSIPPIRYNAIKDCLTKVNEWCKINNATIHCPKFGAGLAGGNWDHIERNILKEITVPVIVYEYK